MKKLLQQILVELKEINNKLPVAENNQEIITMFDGKEIAKSIDGNIRLKSRRNPINY